MVILGCALLPLFLFLVPLLFLKGTFWLAHNVLPWVIVGGWIALGIDIVILLPLCVVPFLRPWCGMGFLISSYVYGFITWFAGFILTYVLWGLFPLLAGLFLFGVGVVPLGLLAALFKGLWSEFFTLLAMLALTFISRVGGMQLIGGYDAM